MRTSPAILVCSCLLLVVSCGQPGGSITDGNFTLATHPATAGRMLALSGGILSGQVNSDRSACLWIGEEPQRMALIWPAGFTARGTPITVFDGNDKIVAAVGQKVTLGGGLAPDGTRVFGCTAFAQAWIVGRVIGPYPKLLREYARRRQ